MMENESYGFPESGIHRHVSEYIRSLPDLSGMTVVDVPCGDGRATFEFMRKGAEVRALDLFPEHIKVEGVKGEPADLSETLPLPDECADYIICQEGIEHIPNQVRVFEEFNRILKPRGILLLTTPNNSHLRARLAHFFLETDLLRRMPPSEIDSIWFSEQTSDKLYFGHLFLLGVQKLQSLATFTGFKVEERIKTDIGASSLVLSILLYPLYLFVTFLSYLLYRDKNLHVEKAQRRRILWERALLNLSLKTLVCKQIFWVMRKENSVGEAVARLKNMQLTSKECQ